MDIVKKPTTYALMLLLFLVAPFYYKPNLGGTGFNLPFNIAVWGIAITAIFYSMSKVVIEKKIIIPSKVLLLVAFPLILIVTSLLSGVLNANEWIIRQFYILGGLFFLLSLFQFELNDHDIENIMFIVSLSMIIHAGIGLLQSVDVVALRGFIPRKAEGQANGILQQVNVQASYLSTGVLINFYLIARESTAKKSLWFKGVIVFSILISTYMLSNSGSRIGILSLMAGFIMLLFAFRSEYFQYKRMFIASAIILVIGIVLGRSGIGTAIEKGHEIVQGGYADQRTIIYSIALNIAKAEPFWGHGLGSFIKVWNEFAPSFYESHPEVQRVPYITHPHNELFMWLIEGGVFCVIGIFLFCYKVVEAAIKCGWKNGVGCLALLLPITFHTQVELPFYISSLHWFLWLFLIFVLLRQDNSNRKIEVNITSSMVIVSILLLTYFPSMYFLYNCEQSRRDLYDFVSKKSFNKRADPLKLALNNLFFQRESERLVMRSLLFVGLKKRNYSDVKLFLDWANEYIQVTPDEKIYEDMVKAYSLLKNKGDMCKTASKGLLIFPGSGVLLENQQHCYR